jgi:Mg-chelatase subunit ChlD
MSIELAKPEWILVVPFFIGVTLMTHYFAHKIKKSLEVFHFPPVKRLIRISSRKSVQRHSWRGISLMLKITIILLVAFSLAGPTLLTISETSRMIQIPMVEEKDIVGGIVLVVDVSSSMGFTDVSPTRLDVAKQMLVEFVQNASDNVRFGVIAFDSKIRNSLPLMQDKERVIAVLNSLQPSEALPCLEELTDIGYGIQATVSLLAPYTATAGTYATILISDGYANYGYPDPLGSIDLAVAGAANKSIPIYTVHLARIGYSSNPELLQLIANETGGIPMSSTNSDELRNVLELLAKYHTPTREWSSQVEIKTTIPQRAELGHVLMLGAVAVILLLWVGNYKHYKTWF